MQNFVSIFSLAALLAQATNDKGNVMPVAIAALAAQIQLLAKHDMMDVSAAVPKGIDDDESGLGLSGTLLRELSDLPVHAGELRDVLAQSALLEAGLVGWGALSEFNPLAFVWALLSFGLDGRKMTPRAIAEEIEEHISELEDLFSNPNVRAKWAALAKEMVPGETLEPDVIERILEKASGNDDIGVEIDYKTIRLWVEDQVNELEPEGEFTLVFKQD